MEELNLYERINSEEWKDIPEYEGDYKINNKGEVLRINKNSIDLTPMRGAINLCKNGVKKKCSTFIIMKGLFNWEQIPFRLKPQNFSDLEGEIWVPVLGWEEWYSISNKGRLKGHYDSRKTLKQDRLIKPKINTSGYHAYRLCINGNMKDALFHRLVGHAFIPNPDNKPQINHIDFIKTNNCVENLEWCTPLENMAHQVNHNKTYKMYEHGELHENSKLDANKVRLIRKMFHEEMVSQRDIAKKLNVSKGAVSAVIAWRTWFYVDPELKEFYKNKKQTKRKSKNG